MQISNRSAMLKRHIFTHYGPFPSLFCQKTKSFRYGFYFVIQFVWSSTVIYQKLKTFHRTDLFYFYKFMKKASAKTNVFYAPVGAYGTNSSAFFINLIQCKIWTKRYFYFLHNTVYRKKIGWQTIKLYANKQSKCYAETSLFLPALAFFEPILQEN